MINKLKHWNNGRKYVKRLMCLENEGTYTNKPVYVYACGIPSGENRLLYKLKCMIHGVYVYDK